MMMLVVFPVQHTQGKPTYCSQCGSVLDYTYDNLVGKASDLKIQFSASNARHVTPPGGYLL